MRVEKRKAPERRQARGGTKKGTAIVTHENRGDGILCLLWLLTFMFIVAVETGMI